MQKKLNATFFLAGYEKKYIYDIKMEEHYPGQRKRRKNET